MNLNNYETDVPEDQLEKYASKLDAQDLHADSRSKKNQKEENVPALVQEQFLVGREFGLILNQGYSFTVFWKNQRK